MLEPAEMIVFDRILPPTFLCRVLRDYRGFAAPTLPLGARGKGHDEAWPRLRQDQRIAGHHGLRGTAGFGGAPAAGKLDRAAWTLPEQLFGDLGLHRFADAMREARLTSFHADPLLRQAQLAQFSVNVPLLLLAGHDLLRRAEVETIDTLLMCSRDCNLWIKLLGWLARRSPRRPAIRYLAASRVLFLSESPAYMAYFQQAKGHRNFLVDVAGTGRSAMQFIGRTGDGDSTRLYIAVHGRSETADFVSQMTVPQNGVALDSLCQLPFETRFPLECLNVSLEGRAHCAVFDGGAVRIAREPNEYGPAARAVITTMRASFLHLLACLSRIGDVGLPHHVDTAAVQAASVLILGQLESFAAPLLPIRLDTLSQETHVGAAAKQAGARRDVAGGHLASGEPQASPGAS